MLFVCAFVASDAACHLYFDLEFDRHINADHVGERMVDIFLQVMHVCTNSELFTYLQLKSVRMCFKHLVLNECVFKHLLLSCAVYFLLVSLVTCETV